MTKPGSNRDSLNGFIRDLDTRLGRQERHTHHGVGSLGPGGEMFISADYGNDTKLGSDSGVYTREIFASATTPTARDFGGRMKPGYVWVELGGCGSFEDDFERPAGPINNTWLPGRLRDIDGFYGVVTLPMDIVSGHVESAMNDVDFPEVEIADVMWPESYPGTQYVQATTANYHQGWNTSPEFQIVEGRWFFYCQASDETLALTGVIAEHLVYTATSGEVFAYVFQQDAGGNYINLDLEGYAPGWPNTGPQTMRLEVSPEGHVRFLVGDVVAIDGDVPPVVGPHVGFGFEWHRTNYFGPDDAGDSFWTLDAAGGCLVSTEEPPEVPTETTVGKLSAWTGAEWLLCPAYGWDGSQWVAATAVHCWDGIQWIRSLA